MHYAAFNYVFNIAQKINPRRRIIEIGGRNLNGSIKPLFSSLEYLSIDLYPGPNVDWVGDAADYVPDKPVDTIVCCEVLEHAPEWPNLIKHAYDMLEPQGILLVTCATDPRPPHSGIDRDGTPPPEEYYGNVDPTAFAEVMDKIGFNAYRIDLNKDRGDLYCLAEK